MVDTNTPTTADFGYFRVRDVARGLGIGPRTVYRAIAAHELRAARVNDRGDLLTRREWIDAWLERRAARGDAA